MCRIEHYGFGILTRALLSRLTLVGQSEGLDRNVNALTGCVCMENCLLCVQLHLLCLHLTRLALCSILALSVKKGSEVWQQVMICGFSGDMSEDEDCGYLSSNYN